MILHTTMFLGGQGMVDCNVFHKVGREGFRLKYDVIRHSNPTAAWQGSAQKLTNGQHEFRLPKGQWQRVVLRR